MQQDEIIFEGKRYIVVDAAAKESGRTREYLMTQCRLGKLEGRRIGRVWYIDHASLIAFVDDQQRALERHYQKLSEERAEEYSAHQLISAIEHTPEKDQTEISPAASEPLVRENVSVVPPRHIMSFFSAEGAALIILLMFISSAGLLSWYARSGDEFTVFGGTPILEKLSGIFSFSRNDPSPPGTLPHQEGFAQQTINNNDYNTTNVYDTSTTNNNNYNSYLTTTKVEGINEGVLSARIKALDDTLTERMYSLVSANTTNITQVYQTLGAVARGDNFNDIKVTDSAWTEGSITDATISGGTITGATSISAGSLTLSNPLGVSSGGTGVGSYTAGDILYASSTDTLAKLSVGTNGQLLSITNGIQSWSSLAGSGSIGVWATTSDSLAIYTADSSDVVLIGASATTTTGNIFETLGNSLFRGTLTSYNTVTASSFTATSTSVTSQFINASSTALSALDYLAVGRTATTTIRGNTSTSTFSGPITSASGDLELGGFTSSDNLILNRYGGNVGVGTTSPFAKLAVHAFSGETNQTLFAVASSTSSATTTLFSISNTGTTTLGRFGTCSGANALTTDYSGNIVCGAVTGTGDGVGEWFVADTFGTSASVSTSTLTGFTQGLYSLASSTIGNGTQAGGLTIWGGATTTGNLLVQGNATTTALFATTASTTNFYGAGLTLCTSGNVLTYNGSGSFGCTADQTATGAANPFTWETNYGLISAATTSPIWAKVGLFASSTSQIAYASTTAITATTASTTNLIASNSFTLSNFTGFLKATAGVVATSLIDLTSDITGILGVTNGGTGWGDIQANSIVLGNGAGALATTTAGTNGQVLALANGVPTWTATTTFAGGLTYANGAVTLDWLFPGNATTTGLGLYASTTIGAGGQATGLTISGGATTTVNLIVQGTGNSTFAGNVGIGTTTLYSKLSVWGASAGNIFEAITSASSSALTVSATGFGTTTVTGLTVTGSATSTSDVGWNIATGCFAINDECVGGGATLTGTTGQLAYFSGTDTAAGTSTLFISTASNVGIGTTSPYAKLSVWGGGSLFEVTNTASTTLFAVADGALGSIFTFGQVSTSTVPNNQPYAWTIATSTTASPLFRIDSTTGSESVSFGVSGPDVVIRDGGGARSGEQT